MNDFDIEFALDRIEPRAQTLSAEHAIACFVAHARGDATVPPWPAELGDRALLDRLAAYRDRAHGRISSRRANMLWRLVARGYAAGGLEAGATLSRQVDRQNRRARELGFADFHELALALDDIASDDLEPALTDPRPPRRAAGERSPVPVPVPVAVTPERVIDVIEQTLGLPTAGVRIAWLPPSAGPPGGSRPRAGARTYFIDPGRDVRVVASPPRTVDDVATLLHELGHALYAMGHDASLPWSLRDAPSRVVHEAVAELVAGLLESTDVAAALTGLDRARAVDVATRRAARRRSRQRRQRARACFERALYRGAERDLDAAYRALGGRGDWRSIRHLWHDPGSQACYLLAERVRAELAARYDLSRPGIGARLAAAIFRPGACLHWRVLLETGPVCGDDRRRRDRP